MGIIMVQVTMSIPGFIFGEAFLVMWGLGIRPPGTVGSACIGRASKIDVSPHIVFSHA